MKTTLFTVLFFFLAQFVSAQNNQISSDNDAVVAKLIKKLKTSKDSDVRRSVAFQLRKHKKAGDKIVPALIAALQDEDEDNDVRACVAESLGAFEGEAETAIPALIEALEDEDDAVRCGAACALGEIKKRAVVVVPALIEMLKQGKGYSNARWHAIYALGEFGEEAEAAVRLVMATLVTDNSSSMRGIAALTLGKIGKPDDIRIILLLASVHKDEKEDPYVIQSAYKALLVMAEALKKQQQEEKQRNDGK